MSNFRNETLNSSIIYDQYPKPVYSMWESYLPWLWKNTIYLFVKFDKTTAAELPKKVDCLASLYWSPKREINWDAILFRWWHQRSLVITQSSVAKKDSVLSINVFKVHVSTKKTSENTFQHGIYGTASKLFHRSHVTANWQ